MNGYTFAEDLRICWLRRRHRVFAQCWRGRQCNVFQKFIFSHLRLSRLLKAIKRQWVRFSLSFAVVNIIKKIFVIKLRLHDGKRSPVMIWLCLWFSSICFGKISKIFIICENCLPSFKSRKKIAVSSPFVILGFLPLNFFNQQALGTAQICLTVQQNLGNFIEGNAINLTRKMPISFVAKYCAMEWNFVNIGIWSCVTFRICRIEQSFPQCFLSSWPLLQA